MYVYFLFIITYYYTIIFANALIIITIRVN